MREILFRGKAACGAWVQGDLIHRKIWQSKFEVIRVDDSGFDNYQEYEVATDTIGQYTGLTDKNGKKIFEGDIVEFLGSKYEVLFECGAFGIAGVSDWEAIEKQIPISTGCDNDLCACLNDNYISLWEIYWNLENSHEVLDTVKIIGNIHDNPELLEVNND